MKNRSIFPLSILFFFLWILISPLSLATATASPYLGQKCFTKFDSKAGTSTENGSDSINLICFKSLNDPDIWVWGKDNNLKPVNSWPLGEVAYGRNYGGADQTCKELPVNSSFYKFYGPTYCDTQNHVWMNDNYQSNIVPNTFVPPIQEISTVGKKSNPDKSAKKQDAVNTSTTFMVLGAYLMIMTPATIPGSGALRNGSSSNFPNNAPYDQTGSVPEYLEIRARRDRKVNESKFHRNIIGFLFSPIITLTKYKFFEKILRSEIEKISRVSPGLGTILGDGDYLRAVIGSLNFILYPLSIAIAIYNFTEIEANTNSNLLPSFLGMSLLISIGIIDSFAGAISGSLLLLFIAVSNLFHSKFNLGKHEIVTAITIFLLSCAPILFAGALRNFDREHTDSNRKWNHAVDYFLSPLVTSWLVWKVLKVLSLNFAEVDFENPNAPILIAGVVWVLVVCRYFLEHYVVKNWSDRLNVMIPNSTEQIKLFGIFGYLFKIIWIWLLITSIDTLPQDQKFVTAIIFLMIVPGILKFFWKNPPKQFAYLNLRGAPKIAIYFLLGLLVEKLLSNENLAISKELILGLAIIPPLFFSIMEALMEDKAPTSNLLLKNWIGVIVNRVLGMFIYLFIAGYIFYMIFGK
jgi:hypothetical protein